MTEITDQDIYQSIGAMVVEYAPEDWQAIIVTADIEEDYGKVIYDYIDGNGETQWFSPPEEDQYQAYLSFQALWQLMKGAGHEWKSVVFRLEQTGKFNVKFEYTEATGAL